MDNNASVSDLIEQLKLEVDPAQLFDPHHELPPWLVQAEEHQLVKVDGGGDHSKPPAYWMKVSSIDKLRHALNNVFNDTETRNGLESTLPLYIFLMPTTPLSDARRISNIVAGEDVKLRIGEQVDDLQVVGNNIVVSNPDALTNKHSAWAAAVALRDDIRVTRYTVDTERNQLSALAEPKLKHAEETLETYNDAKAVYKVTRDAAPKDEQGGMQALAHEQLAMMTAAGRLLIAREVATTTAEAARSLASLSELLAKREADLDAAMTRPTFMGCAPPPPPPPDAGGDAGGGN